MLYNIFYFIYIIIYLQDINFELGDTVITSS